MVVVFGDPPYLTKLPCLCPGDFFLESLVTANNGCRLVSEQGCTVFAGGVDWGCFCKHAGKQSKPNERVYVGSKTKNQEGKGEEERKKGRKCKCAEFPIPFVVEREAS